MLFNSLEYLLFLILVFSLFWSMATLARARVVLLLVASWVFYMSWNATFIVLIVGSTVLDFGVGRGLARTDNPRTRRGLLMLSLVGNLGALGLFKYADFFLGAFHGGLAALGSTVEVPRLNLVLPVGISFYTFQTLSYTVDVYRRRIEPARTFAEFATFVAFFPQLVAGPIVRAGEFLPQFRRSPQLGTDAVGNAIFLILRGMAKKILIADYLAANLIDRVWDDPGAHSTGEVWVAVYAYTWQLYGDFSGYTDIARGSAKLFGFELPENFRRPFNTTGPIDFWSRWHITLSSWVRDYVYIPLGGSRRGPLRGYLNTFVAFLLTGLWHGAGWTFVCFAVWHAVTVTLNRAYRDLRGPARAELRGAGRAALVALNLFLFVVHWPMFRSTSLENMLAMYERMFAWEGGAMRVHPMVWAVLLGFTVVHMSPTSWAQEVRGAVVRAPVAVQAGLVVAVSALLMWVGSSQAAPFIYFQF